MAYEDAVSGVELAGRSVIIRAPSEVAGYEYRLQWTWDPQQQAMLLTHDEMLRTGGRKHYPRRPSRPHSHPRSHDPSDRLPHALVRASSARGPPPAPPPPPRAADEARRCPRGPARSPRRPPSSSR